MSTPKAFVTYSHDSPEHKMWVLELATKLRNNGVDASLDQWDLGPGADLPNFMEKHLAAADRVLMICTEKYVEKANAGKGGVGYEKMILTAELMNSIESTKVIPLIRQNGTHLLPTFMRSKIYLDFSRADQFEFSYDELLRSLHNAPLYKKPPVADNPFTPPPSTPPAQTGDGILAVMTAVISVFEIKAGGDNVEYSRVHGKTDMSRIMFDTFLAQAVNRGLVAVPAHGWITLTSRGKQFAIENKLVRLWGE